MRPSLSMRSLTGPISLAVGALIAVLAFVAVDSGKAVAEPEAKKVIIETKFLAVSGEGPTAKGWYEGAQPSGVPLQRALDKFSQDGFYVVKVVEPHASKAGNVEFVWNIVMERRTEAK